MGYKVINKFREKHDNHRLYEVGDPYPFNDEGYKPTKKRLEYLSKPNPKFNGVAFLEEMAEPKKKKEAKTKETKEKKEG